MIPTFLITLREVIEATLIVATIFGVLAKLNQSKQMNIVWLAILTALFISFLLVFGGSVVGVHIQQIYTGAGEGIVYILSAFFITWAVFFLHNQFGRKKMHLISHMQDTITKNGLFAFTFVAVAREGIETALFLSTQYITSSPASIITGFTGGIVMGICVSVLFFYGTIRLPIFWAFRTTSYLLILFAGMSLALGIGEFHIQTITTLPAIAALAYMFLIHRWVFVRSR